MPQLDVPVSLQDEDARTCLLHGVYLMLAYDDAAPSEELLRIETDEIGTYFPQVGAWLERRGYDTTFISAHPKLFTEQAKDYTDDELIEQRVRRTERAR